MATRLAEPPARQSSAALATPALPSAPTSAAGRERVDHGRRDLRAALALALALGPRGPTEYPVRGFRPAPARAGREWVPREGGSRARAFSSPLNRRRGGCSHAQLRSWAAQGALSDVATPRALRNRSAQGGNDARDLHREVTTARRPEDLGEAQRDAPANNLLDVTPVLLAPSLCFARTRSSGGNHQAGALARVGKFGRPALRSGPTGPPPPSSNRTGSACPLHSPLPAAEMWRGLGEAVSRPDEP